MQIPEIWKNNRFFCKKKQPIFWKNNRLIHLLKGPPGRCSEKILAEFSQLRIRKNNRFFSGPRPKQRIHIWEKPPSENSEKLKKNSFFRVFSRFYTDKKKTVFSCFEKRLEARYFIPLFCQKVRFVCSVCEKFGYNFKRSKRWVPNRS